LALKKIKIFGITVLEVETTDDPDGSPDFTSDSQPAGFVDTRIVPEVPGRDE